MVEVVLVEVTVEGTAVVGKVVEELGVEMEEGAKAAEVKEVAKVEEEKGEEKEEEVKEEVMAEVATAVEKAVAWE